METKPIKAPKLYQALSMNRAKKIADELVKFVKANDLSVDIAGKNYLYTEAWQFIGETQLGLTHVPISCDRVVSDNPKEIKYKSVVEIFNQQGTIISRGFAYCSNLEKKKTSFEEYAVASMAQTRGIGKAYRNILAWIVKMAGYEATPYEEVDKDKMETDLGKAKQNIVKAMKAQGINDSSDMMAIIQQAIGKDLVENIDEANKVMDYLNRETNQDAWRTTRIHPQKRGR